MSNSRELMTNLAETATLDTIDSIITVLETFKNGQRADDYEMGYDDGMDQAIRATKLFRTIIEQKQIENLNV